MGGLVQDGDGVGGEVLPIAGACDTEPVSQVLSGVVGARGVEVDPVLEP